MCRGGILHLAGRDFICVGEGIFYVAGRDFACGGVDRYLEFNVWIHIIGKPEPLKWYQ